MWQYIYKHTTNVSAEQLWATIIDIENWNTWDSEIESTKLNGPLEVGTCFMLKPKGGPTVKLTVEEFTRPTRFADLAHLPLGRMRTIHEFHPVASGTEISVTIQITGIFGFLWRKVIGEKQAAGMPSQTLRFIEQAKNRYAGIINIPLDRK